MKTKKIELQKVTKNQAKMLKEIGFDCKVEFYYNSHGELYRWNGTGEETPNSYPHYEHTADCYSAPSIALALKWAMEEEGIINKIDYDHEFQRFYGSFVVDGLWDCTISYDNYEEAETNLLTVILIIILKQGE